MTAYLKARGMRMFDYPKWGEQWHDLLCTHVETLAAAEGLRIEFITKVKAFRKEDRSQKILAQRGTHPGLVRIFSAIEPCPSNKPWHDKQTHETFLKPDSGKCLHYYFYFIYEPLKGTAIHTVKAAHVATFLGHKLTAAYRGRRCRWHTPTASGPSGGARPAAR